MAVPGKNIEDYLVGPDTTSNVQGVDSHVQGVQSNIQGGTNLNDYLVDRRVSESLRALSDPKTYTPSRPPAPRAVIPAQMGKTTRISPVAPAGGTGFAGPLTETAYADRVSFPSNYITTSDGLFTVQCLQKIKFTDANSTVLWLEFKHP